MTKDIGGYNGFGIMPTYDIKATTLAKNVAQSCTVPVNYPNWIAIFSYTPGSSVWVDFTTTASVAGGAFASSTSSLNPSARSVKAGDTISVITSDDFSPQVSIEFQVIQPYQN